jgi:hypothetical protein
VHTLGIEHPDRIVAARHDRDDDGSARIAALRYS